MLKPRILDIDDTPSHIATLLAAQTNDQERYALAEKTVMKLINKNNEKLLKEQTDLLEDNDKLLKEQTDLLEGNEKLLKEQNRLVRDKNK